MQNIGTEIRLKIFATICLRPTSINILWNIAALYTGPSYNAGPHPVRLQLIIIISYEKILENQTKSSQWINKINKYASIQK